MRSLPRVLADPHPGPHPDHHPDPRRHSRLRSLLPLAVAAGSIGAALAGCAPIQPWVKPYQREHLADPIMSFDRDPASSAYLDHVYSVRQAARGGTGAVGGGCGCN